MLCFDCVIVKGRPARRRQGRNRLSADHIHFRVLGRVAIWITVIRWQLVSIPARLLHFTRCKRACARPQSVPHRARRCGTHYDAFTSRVIIHMTFIDSRSRRKYRAIKRPAAIGAPNKLPKARRYKMNICITYCTNTNRESGWGVPRSLRELYRVSCIIKVYEWGCTRQKRQPSAVRVFWGPITILGLSKNYKSVRIY